MITGIRSFLRLGGFFLVLPAAVRAAADFDLSRRTPVASEEQIPVADFFRAPLFSQPQLSPNGERFVALVETGNDHTGLFVYDLTKRQSQAAMGPGDSDVYSVAWLNSDRLLLSLSREKIYAAGLVVADAGKISENYPVETNNATSLVAVPRKEPMHPLIWILRNAYDDGEDMGVVQIDAKRSLNRNEHALIGSMQYNDRDRDMMHGTKASIVASYPQPPGMAVNYLADKDGALAFAITVQDGTFSLFRFSGKKWVLCPVNLDEVFPVSHGDRPGELIVIGPREAGVPRGIQKLDTETGRLGELLYRDKMYDVDACSFYAHPATGDILGVRFSRNRMHTAWFSQGYADLQTVLEGLFPNSIVQLIGSNNDETRFFLAVYSDREPAAYYAFDLAKKKVELIHKTAPWFDSARMRPMNILKFKTRDGHQLEGYLTLPAGASKQTRVPLVVLPHGGPWARDTWGFDREAQFLASRGYAVLQPNYRGSPGYDWKFPQNDMWAFRKMHDDVTDAVKTLLTTGLIDAERVAIMGTSFGGYLAACGAAFEPEMYRCAIAIAGVFDWERVLKEARSKRFESAEFGILLRNLGDPAAKQEEFDEISPLRHVSKIKIPFLVAHGKVDDVASISESRALIAELEKHNVPFDTLFVRGEGHGMSRLKNQVELYSRVEQFLAAHLAPRRTAAAPAGAGAP